MTRKLLPALGAVGLVCLNVGSLTGLAAPEQEDVFRSQSRVVAIYATARDQNGRLVTDLSRDDFEIRVDGRPAPLASFSSTLEPLTVAIMVDASFSQTGGGASTALRLNPGIRPGVLAFVDALDPLDRASLGTFGMEIAVGANLTRDRAEFVRVLDEEMWGGGGTPLWQALGAAVEAIAREPGRRVVLALTDGLDSGAWPGFPQGSAAVEARALASDCLIYVVRVASNRPVPDDAANVAAITGGGHVVVPRGGDLVQAFDQVARELRQQYLIGINAATSDGRRHQVEVRVSRAGVTVRARQSFVAEARP